MNKFSKGLLIVGGWLAVDAIYKETLNTKLRLKLVDIANKQNELTGKFNIIESKLKEDEIKLCNMYAEKIGDLTECYKNISDSNHYLMTTGTIEYIKRMKVIKIFTEEQNNFDELLDNLYIKYYGSKD